MTQASRSKLFTPLRLGPLELKNRTIRAAAFEGMSAGNAPTPALFEYHEAVAAGGVGMTTVAYAAVDRGGLSFGHQLWLRREIVPELARLTSRIHEHGAKASIQIGHAGNMAKRSVTGRRPVAPSARPNLYGPTWPRAMDRADLTQLVSSFEQATHAARDAGFDAVEVHAGHGYLISQFLSPSTNHRDDDFGGTLERRMRLLREVIEAVLRAASGATAVLVKMNLSDGFRGGQTLDDAIEIAKVLERDGAHALVLSGGFVSRTPMYIMRGAMPIPVMAEQANNPLLSPFIRAAGPYLVPEVPYEDLYFLRDALRVRAEVKMPLVYIGGVTSRATAERALDAGFDAVAIARALIREPDFVRRMEAELRAASPCDHCNYCAARIYGAHMVCSQLEPPPAHLARFVRPARSA